MYGLSELPSVPFAAAGRTPLSISTLGLRDGPSGAGLATSDLPFFFCLEVLGSIVGLVVEFVDMVICVR